MNAEIISVGTELLLGQIVDTDAAAVAQLLSRLGIAIYHRVTVGDNPDRLTEALMQAFERANLVITIGGIGPTQDDLTREVVAAALNVPLRYDAEHRARLAEMAKQRNWDVMPPSFLKQAQIPSAGRGIPNPNGTALGAIFETNGKIAICLPGPPSELIPMLDASVEPYLLRRTAGTRTTIHSRVMRVIGIGEPAAEERVKDLIAGTNPTVAPYAKTGEVHLRVTARAETREEADALIDPVAHEIKDRLGDHVYGVDDETLERVVVKLLQERSMTIAAAESCSGGLIAKRITDVPDASRVFGLSVVSYSNEAKEQIIHVPAAEIAEFGAVSPEVAQSMARGALKLAGADVAVSVTGIAGPSGGSEVKPVGTVHIGLAWGDRAISQHHIFMGQRAEVAARSAQAALELVRLWLIRPDDPTFTTP